MILMLSTIGRISSCGYSKKKEHMEENEDDILHVCICMFGWSIKCMKMRQEKHVEADH